MESRPRKIQIYEGADGERPFETWFNSLQPLRAKTSIAARLDRAERGSLGGWKSVQDGVCELRVQDGPGYRVYFVRRSEALVILVSGGDKRTQDHDIAMAIKLAREL